MTREKFEPKGPGIPARYSFAERQAEKNRFLALHRRANRTHSTSDPVNFYDVVEGKAAGTTALPPVRRGKPHG